MLQAMKIPQPIIDHAKRELSLSEEDITVLETPIPELPKHMDVFYLEQNRSYGNDFHIYVISEGELFCSSDEDSFGRLLRKEQYLANRKLNTDQLITLFRFLKGKIRDSKILRESDLKPGGAQEQFSGQASPPTVRDVKDGVEIVFWTKHLRFKKPEKWTVSIFPDYRVEYQLSA